MNSVIKAASYILAHTPDMVIHNGATQTTERIVNPDSEYLKLLPGRLRDFETAMSYPPNQVYIGAMTPEALGERPQPWYGTKLPGAERRGKMGEIMPQDEFIMLIKVCDVFELVHLTQEFVERTKPAFAAHPLITQDLVDRVGDGVASEQAEKFVNEEHAEPLYDGGRLVGYIKRAHDVDINLSAHVMHENLVSKASSVLALLNLTAVSGVPKADIDFVIDCAEEACGDMNQRGGGNFAKAAAETAGYINAGGKDTRAFCAAPTHAIIEAAALVKSGTYKNVVVCSGGCTAKLGMNGKDHVKKDIPILEDVIGGFAVLVSENDGVSPELDSSVVGKHNVGTGSSPQAVITSLVLTPLQKAGMKIADVGKYSPEMQNPDVTKPAGAGDVPLANYKMIAALAVKNGEIARTDIDGFVKEHGMEGWAPTQGHIPSGVPYIGFAREDILAGKIDSAMIIGKGSLFLGRMTNLFDGVSILMRKNSGKKAEIADSGAVEALVKSTVAKALREFAAGLAGE